MGRTRNLAAPGVLVTAAVTALSGCASAEKPGVSMGAVNDVCPMSGRPIDPQGPTVEYRGRTVGFCSGGCVSPWDKMTPAEKDAFLARYE
jgi:hypothetical protein